MNAKEFLEKEYYWDKTMNDDMGHTEYIAEKMEAYHRAKVGGVTDEEIYNHVEADCRSEHGHVIMDEQAYFEGAKWLRNKLLNQ